MTTAATEVWRRFLDKELAWDVATFAPRSASTAREPRQNATAWQNYLRRGYPQYPWENFANRALVSSVLRQHERRWHLLDRK